MQNNLSHDGGGFDEKRLEDLFQAAFVKNYPKINSLAFGIVRNKQDAEDIVLKAFTELWKKGTEILKNEDAVGAFLHTVTRNAGISHLRRQKNNPIDYPEQLDFDPADDEVERLLIRQDVVSILHPWIESLPGRAMEVLKMYYIEGMSNEEIAETLHIGIQAVRNYKSQALKSLKEDLPPDIRALWSYLAFIAMLFKN